MLERLVRRRIGKRFAAAPRGWESGRFCCLVRHVTRPMCLRDASLGLFLRGAGAPGGTSVDYGSPCSETTSDCGRVRHPSDVLGSLPALQCRLELIMQSMTRVARSAVQVTASAVDPQASSAARSKAAASGAQSSSSASEKDDAATTAPARRSTLYRCARGIGAAAVFIGCLAGLARLGHVGHLRVHVFYFYSFCFLYGGAG